MICQQDNLYTAVQRRYTAVQRRHSVDEPGDLLEKGFQLAHFIINDRANAISILTAAMSKLAAQRTRERKRIYWRHKHLKRKITRVIREDSDLLQWLIYFEAEKYECQQEEAANHTTEDFAIRYIKHLIQITTSMSSFYVTVGLQRLLYAYSTAETRNIYEWMTEHYPGSEEYRKVKGILMRRLQSRFGHLLKTCQSNRGELKFETYENQECFIELVRQCLKTFTPWTTAHGCWVPEMSMSSHRIPSQFLEIALGKSSRDAIESHRLHGLIHPSCFENLMKMANQTPPSQRLGVPRLFMNAGDDDWKATDLRNADPGLQDRERQQIVERLNAESSQRRLIRPQILRIVVDGKQCMELFLKGKTISRCELPENARFVEIWSNEVILATHWIDYAESHLPAPQESILELGGFRELVLKIIPNSSSAELVVECLAASRWSLWRGLLLPAAWQPQYALIGGMVLMILLSIVAVAYRFELVKKRVGIEAGNKDLERGRDKALQQSVPDGGTVSVAAYRLTDDDQMTRGSQERAATVVTLPTHLTLVTLELPVASDLRIRYRATLKSLLNDETIIEEDHLKATADSQNISVIVFVPSSLLNKSAYYVVRLNAINNKDSRSETRTFTFQVN